jgi:uncharacterized OsmC-like protein
VEDGDHREDALPHDSHRRCPTHAQTRAHAGRHELVIDEPVARGGTNEGPTSIETMIAALLSCTNVILNRVAEKHRVEVGALSLAAEARFDRRGVMLEEVVAVPFPEIRLVIHLTTPARGAGRTRQGRSRPVLSGVESHPSVGNQARGDLERHPRVMNSEISEEKAMTTAAVPTPATRN